MAPHLVTEHPEDLHAATRRVLEQCVSVTGLERAFLASQDSWSGRETFCVLAHYATGNSPMRRTTQAMRYTVSSAIESACPALHVGRAQRHSAEAHCRHLLIAVPIIQADHSAWKALVAQGVTSGSCAPIIQAMQALAQQLAMIQSTREWPGGGQVPPSAQRDELFELSTGVREEVLMHELRVPLGAAGYLLEKLTSNHPKMRQADITYLVRTAQLAIGETQAILRWVSQLHAIARGNHTPELAPVSVRETVEHALALLPAATSRVRVAVPDEVPPVAANALWLTQVLTNLIENAVKYMPLPEVARLSAVRTARDGVTISVTAPGPGIPVEAQQAVFRPYARGRPSYDLTSKGLGLSIARFLVKKMGGDISVESDGLRGTTLSVVLSTADREDLPAEVKP